MRVISEPMVPLRHHLFRVTDGCTHAVEFEADSHATFVDGIARAHHLFEQDRPSHPKAPPRALIVHAYDGEWWVDVRCQKSRRIMHLTLAQVWMDSNHWWESARLTSDSINHMQSQIGKLTNFCKTDDREPPSPRIRLVK